MTKYKYFGQLCKLADEAHILYRNEKNRWLTVWTEEDLKWCIDMGFMYEDKPLYHLGENEFHQYFALTDEGHRLAEWYTYDTWFYIKYVILHWNFWKYKVIHPFMKKVFHKHYTYEEYD